MANKEVLFALGGAALGSAITYYLLQGKNASKFGKNRAPRRCAGVCRLKKDMQEQYTQLHDHTWDEVQKRMYDSNMRNFVVYYHEETGLMFHHWEYVGEDFDADMAKCDNDPTIKRWWTYCEPCQDPFHWEGKPPSQGGDGGPGGSWWANMTCLNHCGGWPVAWTDALGPPPGWVKNNPGKKESNSKMPKDHLVHNCPN